MSEVVVGPNDPRPVVVGLSFRGPDGTENSDLEWVMARPGDTVTAEFKNFYVNSKPLSVNEIFFVASTQSLDAEGALRNETHVGTWLYGKNMPTLDRQPQVNVKTKFGRREVRFSDGSIAVIEDSA
jgi:hypothetical protein